MLDHARGQIDAEDVEAAGTEVGAETTSAAAGVKDRAKRDGSTSIGEVVNHRDVEGGLRIEPR